ncbi:MAG: bifunctional chorismate mutase/prephenate dehydratase [Clostridiales bacterium]|nr:bifunctional chorismate mutase/prephenate dehydratase [Clostridiales bacterium]
MTQKESSTRIEEIDREIAKLVEERLEASQRADEGLPASEIAQKCRRYERGFMNGLEQDYKDISGYERVLFQALFNMSHSYKNTQYGTKTELADRIKEAIEKTPKLFPTSGTIACQGIEGAYSQIATDKIFAHANIMYFKTFDGVFQAVESGLCEYGMLPIENSSYGSVTQVYDLMAGHNFHIARDYKLKINHQLLVKPGTKLSDVKEVYSHSQAIGQCSRFLKEHSEIKINVVENTAVAARMVADSERNDVAAISSSDCRELYGLASIPGNIMNTDHNYTRFICITKDLRIYPGASKTSIMMTLGHKPGALADTLAKFSSLGLNLTKIESRPIAGSDFEFMFYLDFEASAYSDEVVKLLCQLDAEPSDFAYLGTYI